MLSNKRKWRLYASVVAIVLTWCFSVGFSVVFAADITAIGKSFWSLFNSAMVSAGMTLGLIMSLLWLSGDGLAEIGFSRCRLLYRLGSGVLMGIGMFVLATFIIHPISSNIAPSRTSDTDLAALLANPLHLPFWIMLCVVKGGLAEELWRVLALDRFERCFGRGGLFVAVVLSSCAFAFGHLYQGIDSVISTGVTSIIYAGIYVRRQSAVELVTAHATRDIVGVSLGYLVF